jgi:RNA polymerase sigma-70 factor (ECF subfamily)
MAEDVTQLLKSLRTGDKKAESRLIALVYDELRTMASRFMRRERADHTLQTTALVNEAYLRLVVQRETDWKDRAHFFGVAAQVMRHILVDYARGRLSGKRGGGMANIPLDDALVISEDRLEDLLVLDSAFQKLEEEDPRATQVVIFRFYGGLTVEEIAEVLRISPRTVKRDWNYGRAWLRAELSSR